MRKINKKRAQLKVNKSVTIATILTVKIKYQNWKVHKRKRDDDSKIGSTSYGYEKVINYKKNSTMQLSAHGRQFQQKNTNRILVPCYPLRIMIFLRGTRRCKFSLQLIPHLSSNYESFHDVASHKIANSRVLSVDDTHVGIF